MGITSIERELKRGSAELLILALLEEQERHGYQIAQLITERSDGVITFHVTSLYPTLWFVAKFPLKFAAVWNFGWAALQVLWKKSSIQRSWQLLALKKSALNQPVSTTLKMRGSFW